MRATFQKPDSYNSLSSRSFFLVSPDNPKHQGECLKAIIDRFNKAHIQNPEFKKLDVLIAGTLQRHNFWTFSERLSDGELIQLLGDIPPDMDLESAARILAEKFYSAAKKGEEEYIVKNKDHYLKLTGIRLRFMVWHHAIDNRESRKHPNECIRRENPQKLEPIFDERGRLVHQLEIISPEVNQDSIRCKDTYAYYHRMVTDKYKEDPVFRKGYDDTSTIIIEKYKQSIVSQAQRISRLIPNLRILLENPVPLAMLCSRNYLFEEMPLLYPVLSDDYDIMIYPVSPPPAFKVTKELFKPKAKIEFVVLTVNPDTPENDLDKGFSDGSEIKHPVFMGDPEQLTFYHSSGEPTIEENEKKLVTARFNHILSTLTVFEKTIVDKMLRTYDTELYVRSTICSSIIFNKAILHHANKEDLLARQLYRDCLLVSDYFTLEVQARINQMENNVPFTRQLSHLSLIDILYDFELRKEWEKIVHVSTEKQLEVLANLERKLLRTNDKPFLSATIFIAKADEYHLRGCYVDAIRCYKFSLRDALHRNQLVQIINKKLGESEKALAASDGSAAEIRVFHQDITFMDSALSALHEELNVLDDFKFIHTLSSPAMQTAFDTTSKKIRDQIRTKYKFSNEIVGYDGLYPEHAEIFILHADFYCKYRFNLDMALIYYKHAVYILDDFIELWDRLDLTSLKELRQVTFHKIANTEKLIVITQNAARQEKIAREAKMTSGQIQRASEAKYRIPESKPSPYLNRTVVKEFLRYFDLLESYHICEYRDSLIAMKSMFKVTKQFIEKVHKASAGNKSIYEVFIPIFDRINQSKLLDKHYRPTFDAYYGIRITANKSEMLGLLREAAMGYLRIKLNYLGSFGLAHLSELSSLVYTAQRLPLFSLNLTNWNSIFFKPHQTPCCDEMDKIYEWYRSDGGRIPPEKPVYIPRVGYDAPFSAIT